MSSKPQEMQAETDSLPDMLEKLQRRLSVVGMDSQVPDPSGRPPSAGGSGAPAASEVVTAGTGFAHALVSKAGCEPGSRKTNQDSMFVLTNWAPAGKATLVGVLDGHGPLGHEVSAFLRNAFPTVLATHASALAAGDTPEALRATFATCDAQLLATGIDCDFSGSTAVVALIDTTGRITVAWTGDSRLVVGRRAASGEACEAAGGSSPSTPEPGSTQAQAARGGGSPGQWQGHWSAVPLTFDHKPDLPGEAERIKKAGGRVEQLVDEHGRRVGPHRVWLRTSWTPGLAMSRALGDVVAHRAGVTSVPDISTHRLAPCDEIIIAATDGLWEFIDNDEAVTLAAKHATPAAACAALAAEAAARWVKEEDGVCDDITILVFFNRSGQ